ncbi:Crp/Fnr family transcriptional regulator [Halomonas korlensis]|uniref:cAMP-binding domain of CRP or a regulatory subunit of cAMP-dependent protein kinases n=1 Tax=Halomonas korlensis TaxID=463301 RepID=A0A1I7JHQ0_9GAMM|nr:Crp/Fnr family transcriptional regulator [Halomonas korlensis]SFU84677.1 cAMP-binding domain of CRP or a regulatory subunit of cAMP-dependent protein kinases [Halomonas korlensis]
MSIKPSQDKLLSYALGNGLLNGLLAPEHERLRPHLETVELVSGDPLGESGKPMSHAYFPIDAVVSLLCAMDDGASTEIAMVGDEGVIGLSLVMGRGGMPGRAIVQRAGVAYRIKAEWFQDEFNRGGGFQKQLLYYMQLLLIQVSQIAACNRYHTLDQQLCRWLLSSLDRLPTHELLVTQEFMANLLGVRREGVTESAGKLQKAGLISYHRGRITILDRKGLEARACECYRVIKQGREYAL